MSRPPILFSSATWAFVTLWRFYQSLFRRTDWVIEQFLSHLACFMYKPSLTANLLIKVEKRKLRNLTKACLFPLTKDHWVNICEETYFKNNLPRK